MYLVLHEQWGIIKICFFSTEVDYFVRLWSPDLDRARSLGGPSNIGRVENEWATPPTNLISISDNLHFQSFHIFKIDEEAPKLPSPSLFPFPYLLLFPS